MSPNSLRTLEGKPLPKVLDRVYRFGYAVTPFCSRCTEVWRKINGYHFGAMCCAWISGSVLIMNITATIWGSAAFGVERGLGTIQNGSCTTTKNLGFWLHLVINVLSTLLLGASNYSMQCLSAPTRSEIDQAHRKTQWLDIGVPSVRNLRRISASRITLWWLLAASSIPLHLFYNSAIFSSLYSREYNVYVVSSDFPTAASFNQTSFDGSGMDPDNSNHFEQLRNNATSLQVLENPACLRAYAGSINSDRGDVLLVSSYDSSNELSPSGCQNPDLTFFPVSPGFLTSDFYEAAAVWICNSNTTYYYGNTTCDLTKSVSTGSSWLFQQWDVQYCLSEQVEEHCKLQFSIAIMIFVICCNFIKMVCMFWIIRKRDSEPLVTLGDAIASFLDTPDQMTLNACLAGQDDLCNNSVQGQPLLRSWEVAPVTYVPKRRFWFGAASKDRWCVCNGLWVSLNPVSFHILTDEQLHPDTYRGFFPSETWALERSTRQQVYLLFVVPGVW